MALGLCALVYAGAVALVFQTMSNRSQRSVSVKAVKLSIAQIELQAESAPMPKPDPLPEPEPVPEKEADVALEEVVEKSEPQPKPVLQPESDAPVAQVTQDASAEALPVDPNKLGGWVKEQIEYEKYYPPAAERFGLTGTFDLYITVDESGTIRSADITSEGGHRILRQALERMLSKIIDLKYPNPIGEPMGFEVEFEFE